MHVDISNAVSLEIHIYRTPPLHLIRNKFHGYKDMTFEDIGTIHNTIFV